MFVRQLPRTSFPAPVVSLLNCSLSSAPPLDYAQFPPPVRSSSYCILHLLWEIFMVIFSLKNIEFLFQPRKRTDNGCSREKLKQTHSVPRRPRYKHITWCRSPFLQSVLPTIVAGALSGPLRSGWSISRASALRSYLVKSTVMPLYEPWVSAVEGNVAAAGVTRE